MNSSSSTSFAIQQVSLVPFEAPSPWRRFEEISWVMGEDPKVDDSILDIVLCWDVLYLKYPVDDVLPLYGGLSLHPGIQGIRIRDVIQGFNEKYLLPARELSEVLLDLSLLSPTLQRETSDYIRDHGLTVTNTESGESKIWLEGATKRTVDIICWLRAKLGGKPSPRRRESDGKRLPSSASGASGVSEIQAKKATIRDMITRRHLDGFDILPTSLRLRLRSHGKDGEERKASPILRIHARCPQPRPNNVVSWDIFKAIRWNILEEVGAAQCTNAALSVYGGVVICDGVTICLPVDECLPIYVPFRLPSSLSYVTPFVLLQHIHLLYQSGPTDHDTILINISQLNENLRSFLLPRLSDCNWVPQEDGSVQYVQLPLRDLRTDALLSALHVAARTPDGHRTITRPPRWFGIESWTLRSLFYERIYFSSFSVHSDHVFLSLDRKL